MTEKSQKTEQESVLTLKRTVKAPAAEVFKAWTTGDSLMRWFIPGEGWSAVGAQADARKGGKYKIELRSPKKEPHTLVGSYEVFEPAKRLRFEWNFAEEKDFKTSTVEVSFSEQGGQTELVVVHKLPEEPSKEHKSSWNAALDRLAGLF